MPNVNFHHHSNEPPRQYPYHLLMINNYRLPPGKQSNSPISKIVKKIDKLKTFYFIDVDRCHLERHLQNTEFEQLFGMNRMDFYRLPEWRRNELKKRVKLF